MKPNSATAMAITNVSSEIDLEKIIPRNRAQTRDTKVGQTKTDYARPSLPIEQVEGEVVRDGRGQFLGGKRPMNKKQVFPILRHERLEERSDHRTIQEGGKSSFSFRLR